MKTHRGDLIAMTLGLLLGLGIVVAEGCVTDAYSPRKQSTAKTSTVEHHVFDHTTSGTAAAGLGTGIKFQAETASGTSEHIGGLYCYLTTATGGALATTCCLQTVSSSSASDQACWDYDGNLFWSDTATDTVSHYVFEHRSSGTVADSGGAGIKLYAETASGSSEHVGGVFSTMTDATGGTVDSEISIQAVANSTAVTGIIVEADGGLRLPAIAEDVGATGTVGQLKIDNAGGTWEICYVSGTNAHVCADLTAGPSD